MTQSRFATCSRFDGKDLPRRTLRSFGPLGGLKEASGRKEYRSTPKNCKVFDGLDLSDQEKMAS